MAGIWPLSFAQRHDLNGAPYPGALAHFYNAETDDPIDIYQDYSSAVAAGTEGKLSNPVEADGFGVFPGVYISGALSFYGFRMTTAAGVVLTPNSTIPNVGPSEEGEGDPVEPVSQFAIFKTGDLKHRFAEGIHEGWLPLNGLTFGSAASGADYVDDDNEALFLFLWAWDSTRVVGGAGASAAADWAANKRFTLPDARGYALVGLDDMARSAASVLSVLDVLGERTGGQTVSILQGNLPNYTLPDTLDIAGSQVGGLVRNLSTPETTSAVSSSRDVAGIISHDTTTLSISGSVTSGGSGTALSIVQPSMGVSIYIKK